MNAEPDNADKLAALAEEFLDRQRKGESPTVEQYAEAHPDLAEEIRELFPAMAAMERLKARSERTSGGSASLGPVQIERLGDFRIIREVGRGGMGVVFEAEQESLGRRVALKVLPRQALLERRHLARFKREARLASRLHHTNIVQVYGVGEQEGFHYYVMQFVRGQGLDKLVAGRGGNPPDGDDAYRRVAKVGVQAAEALQYAHSQGTLHRDVKPSNILLDEEGSAWLTDFGLARSAAGPDVTQPGDLTGTLRYLPPERLGGQVDERGDIYGLGLTLYELATGRCAYEGRDRSALIARINAGSMAPPRRVNPSIPRDLETIILKASSREPRRRYASAGELADDLRRFMEDRPVRARRVGPAERLGRWCRRNPAVASLATATMALIVAVAVIATAGYVRESEQRRKAEAVSKLAREAIDRVFERLGSFSPETGISLTIGDGNEVGIAIPRPAVASKDSAALLEEMLPFYDRLAAQSGDDVSLAFRAAQAKRRIGDIRQRLGQYDKAAAAYEEAIAAYLPLSLTHEGFHRDLSAEIAQTQNELGRTHRLAGDREAAAAAHEKVLALLGDPNDATPAGRYEIARAYYYLGSHLPAEPAMGPPGGRRPGPGRPGPDGHVPPGLGPAGRPVGGPERFGPPPDRPAPGEDRWRKKPPEPAGPPAPEPPRETLQQRRQRLAHLERAVAILRRLIEAFPDGRPYRHLLALCYREASRGGARPGEPDGDAAPGLAGAGIDAAIEILGKLADAHPQTPQYLLDLSETYAMIEPGPPGPRGRHDGPRDAEDRLNKAMEISLRLAATHPAVPEYRASRAHISHKLGQLYLQTRRPEAAEKAHRRAVEVQAALAREFPDVSSYRVWLGAFRNSLAETLLVGPGGGREAEEARDLARATVADMSALLAEKPELWYLHRLLADALDVLSAAYRRLGEPGPADEADARARGHRELARPTEDPAR